MKLRQIALVFTLAGAVLFGGGCQSIQRRLTALFTNQAQTEQQIADIKKEYEGKIEAKEKEVSQAKDRVIAGKDAQMKEAANAMFGANSVFQLIPTPVRTDLMINNFVNEGWKSLGNTAPDYPTLVKINERIKKELDEKVTTLADLQANHLKVMAENQILVDQTRTSEKALKEAETAQRELESKFSKELTTKQNELLAIKDKLIAVEKERADEREALQALKTKISVILGIVALAALAATIYLPVFKTESGLFGAACAAAAVGIWWIQPWMCAAAVGVALVGLLLWMALKHNKETKAATGVYRAIQSIKDTSKEEYDKVIKPKLEQWITTYDKTGKAVPDKAAQQLIDQRLMEVGDK